MKRAASTVDWKSDPALTRKSGLDGTFLNFYYRRWRPDGNSASKLLSSRGALFALKDFAVSRRQIAVAQIPTATRQVL
jgi:hypothetical protein